MRDRVTQTGNVAQFIRQRFKQNVEIVSGSGEGSIGVLTQKDVKTANQTENNVVKPLVRCSGFLGQFVPIHSRVL